MGLRKEEMDIQYIIKEIQSNLSDDLLKPKFRRLKQERNENYLWGHCYVASEVLYHVLGGSESEYVPMRLKVGEITHWYLRNTETGDIVDITAKQFSYNLDYSKGRNAIFLTKDPSKRAKRLMDRIRHCFL